MTTHAVPKNLSKSKSEYKNIPVIYLAVALISGLLGSIFIAVSIFSQSIIIRSISITLVILIAYGFFTMTRTPAMLETSWLELLFFIRELKGKTEFHHFSDTDKKILELVDIIKIHGKGIIEFKDSVFGSLMAYDPERASDDGLEGHIARMQHVIDSLHDDMLLKAYVVNGKDRDRKQLTQYVNELMISGNVSKPQNEHLKSIYMAEKEKQDLETSWKFYLFLSIGKRNDIQDAKIAFDRYFEGFKSKMQGLNVRIARIENGKEIKKVYSELLI